MELRRPDNGAAYMEPGLRFHKSHADADFTGRTTVASKMTGLRQATAALAGGGEDDSIRVPSTREEVSPNHDFMQSSRAQQKGEHTSDGEHI